MLETPTSSLEIHKRCNWTCAYCGFDGRPFDAWMQMTLDHVMPRHCGGGDEAENIVACCASCNSITSKMRFEQCDDRAEILRRKRDKVRESREGYYGYWLENVAPHFLSRPVADLESL